MTVPFISNHLEKELFDYLLELVNPRRHKFQQKIRWLGVIDHIGIKLAGLSLESVMPICDFPMYPDQVISAKA